MASVERFTESNQTLASDNLKRRGERSHGATPAKPSVVRSVFVFSIIMALFYGFVHTPRNDGALFEPYLEWIASITGSLLRVLGYNVAVVGKVVSSSHFSFLIARGCDAIEPTAIFVAAVLASPASPRSKIIGIFIGVVGLFMMNLGRLVGLFYVGTRFPSTFDVIHEDLAQFMFVLLAVVSWAMWGVSARRRSIRLTNACA